MKKKFKIIALSKFFEVDCTVDGEHKTLQRLRSIRKIHEMTRIRKIENMIDLYLPADINSFVWWKRNEAITEARNKARFEFDSDKNNILKVKIAQL